MNRMLSDFLFTEISLAEGQAETAIEVLRVGAFVDRNGHHVEIAPEDLNSFVANFDAGAAGQDVPIDIDHERAEAAGWLRKLWVEGEKLMANVDWNAVGKQLVGDRIYRYLSATIDLATKVIKAISLCNFPAVKGLKPVELQEGVYGLQRAMAPGLIARIAEVIMEFLGGPEAEPEPMAEDEEGDAEFVIRKEKSEIVLYSADGSKVLGRFPFGDGSEYANEETARAAAVKRERQVQYFKGHGSEFEALAAALSSDNLESGGQEESVGDKMTEQELAELKETLRKELEAEAAEKNNTVAELTEKLRKEIQAELTEKQARRQKLAEFAAAVCGGTVGLSAKPDDVVAALEALPEDQVEQVKALLQAKVVDFGERGTTRDGPAKKKPLPEEYAAALRAGKMKVADLSAPVIAADLGELSQYELSEWDKAG